MPDLSNEISYADGKILTHAASGVGVVTFNQYRKLSEAQTQADARSITQLPQVDVIGWQEAYASAPSQLKTSGACPDVCRHGWKWSETATMSKPRRSASSA